MTHPSCPLLVVHGLLPEELAAYARHGRPRPIGDRARAPSAPGETAQNEIAAWKCAGLAERPHRDVLRGPVADA